MASFSCQVHSWRAGLRSPNTPEECRELGPSRTALAKQVARSKPSVHSARRRVDTLLRYGAGP
jgi:hypothetical protein